MSKSKQRSVIYDVVLQSCDHPNAETVLERAKKIMPSINSATVYRNLAALSASSEILKISVDNGDRYDKTVYPHMHFKCKRCNKVFDVSTDDLANFVNAVQDKCGCRVDGCDFIMSGVCSDCLKREPEA